MMFAVMKLAHELGRTEEEINALSPDEFGRWMAYFSILSDQEKRAAQKRNATSGKGSAPRTAGKRIAGRASRPPSRGRRK